MPVPDCVIAICTYRRPERLEKLLTALQSQELGDAKVSIFVVDNDPAASARAAFERVDALGGAISMAYAHVQPQGLVVARNAALAHAAGSCLVFVDDDELPDSRWFQSFWRMHLQYESDVLVGPVRPIFEADVPSWSEGGRYWARTPAVDGSIVAMGGDGNALFPRKLVDSGLTYDECFNTSGAQDTDLFIRWQAAGGKLRYCSGAAVNEYIPATRMTRRYVATRAYKLALPYTWIERKSRRRVHVIRAVGRAGVNTFRATTHLWHGLVWRRESDLVRAAESMALAAGSLAGLVRRGSQRYRI